MPEYAVTIEPPEGAAKRTPIVRHIVADSASAAKKLAASQTGGNVIACSERAQPPAMSATSAAPQPVTALPDATVKLLERMNRSLMTIRTIMLVWFVLTLCGAAFVVLAVVNKR